MASSTEQKAQILNRLFAHKDTSPLILLTDSLAQSAKPILQEFILGLPNQIKLVYWEDGTTIPDPDQGRTLIVIEDMSVIPNIGKVIQQLMGPKVSILGIYHRDLESDPGYAPKGLALVEYMATTIIRVEPNESTRLELVENPMLKFTKFNSTKISVNLVHRRRSGNATTAQFLVDTEKHTTEIQLKTQEPSEDTCMLEGLTTFNLNTTSKQKQDRENVDLPYLAAQEIGDGGAAGGAIIYQYEKDDDYDEEDPYEDPI